jgi:signal transduction histidine kinase
MRSPRDLLRNFVLATLGGLVVVILLALAGTDYIMSRFALDDGEVHNKMIARALSNALEPELTDWLAVADTADPEAATTHPAFRALDAGIDRVSRDLPVLKVEVYRPSGEVVYNGGTADIGGIEGPENVAFQAAAAGTSYSTVEWQEDFVDAAGQPFFRDAVASYLPIVYGGEVIGVFEIYGDYAYVMSLAEVYFPQVAVLVLTTCLLLYGSVTIFVWRAQRRLTRARDDLAAAHARAEMASRAKSVFLANMSHELRTPLNAIMGFSDILEHERFGPMGNARYRDYAGDIRRSGAHLHSLIDDVLDMAKIEAGRVEADPADIDLAGVIADAARMVRGRFDEAQQSLALSLPAGPVPAHTDGRLIRQIVLNLLSNAGKFSPQGAEIRLVLEVGADGATITVADPGIGMSAAELAVARQPFGQTDRGKKMGHAGTGLGLPISMSLVEVLGGELTLDSVPGQGTTARIRLPASILASARPAVAADPRPRVTVAPA